MEKTRKVIPLLICLIWAGSIQGLAQKVKLRKGKVLIDKEQVLDYDFQVNFSETHFYRMGTKNEVLYIKFNNSGTREYKGDDYLFIYFNDADISIESKHLYFGFKGEMAIKKLVEDNVIRKDGTLDEEKLNLFKKKYHQNIIKTD